MTLLPRPSETQNTPRLSKAQVAICLYRYRLGRDPSTTYRSLWPAHPPMNLPTFIRLYMEAVIEYLHPVGGEREAAPTPDDVTNMEQLRKMRDIVMEAAETCVAEPLVDEGDGEKPKIADRLRLVAPLAAAHSAVIKSMREIEKMRLERAAALHSLLASNADRDGDDVLDVPSETDAVE